MKLCKTESLSNSYVISSEEYSDDYNFYSANNDNSLILYHPWKKDENGNYSRKITTYKKDELDSIKLYKAVINDDYKYIIDHLKDFEESIETSNYIKEETNEYIIKSNLSIFNKNDIIYEDESKIKNVLITLIELIGIMGIGYFISCACDCSIKDLVFDISYYNRKYKINNIAI